MISIVQDIFKELSKNSGCIVPLQTRLVPTLVTILQSPVDKVPMGLQAVSFERSLPLANRLGEGNVFTGVCMSTGGGWMGTPATGSFPRWMGMCNPWILASPGHGIKGVGTPPPGHGAWQGVGNGCNEVDLNENG